jgi:hypothetical protein
MDRLLPFIKRRTISLVGLPENLPSRSKVENMDKCTHRPGPSEISVILTVADRVNHSLRSIFVFHVPRVIGRPDSDGIQAIVASN